MLETISLTDGATLTGVFGAGAAVLKYGGQIVAHFARMEVYHKTTSENMEKMSAEQKEVKVNLIQLNEGLKRIEGAIVNRSTIPIEPNLNHRAVNVG